jgi:hypothetical protein
MGIITTICGNGFSGYTGDGGPATAAMIANPQYITIDKFGNLYFSTNACLVRKIDMSGIISTVAGTSTAGYSGDAGPATLAELNNPEAIAVDSEGNIFIADAANYRVRKVNTAGVINTIAGSGTSGFSGDGGPAISAELRFLVGVTIDNAGDLYLGDAQNNRIRKIDTGGIISTIAGDGVSGYTGDGGPATSAELYSPFIAKPDSRGHLYIADYDNFTIRIVDGLPVMPSYVAQIEGTDSVCAGATITLSDSTGYGAWSNGGSTVATVGTNGTVTGVAAGTAVITYVADGSYTTATIDVVSCVTTEVHNSGVSANDISIYPNPAKTQIIIQSTNQPITNITITNIIGQNVYTNSYNIKNVTIDVADFSPGIYFVKTNGTDVKKFVKE